MVCYNAATMTTSNSIWLGACALAVVGIVWWAVTASPAAPSTPSTVADPSSLPGISTATLGTTTPEGTWPVEIVNLEARLAADSMKGQTMEGEVLHIHQHLDIFVHGTPVAVPANIGINTSAGWLSSIHVHDTTGVIHVESPFQATYTLGEFFDIWGVRFTSTCLGGYCADSANMLSVYVNGTLYSGDPRTLGLEAHQEIVVVYGTATEVPATIPTSFDFPQGE